MIRVPTLEKSSLRSKLGSSGRSKLILYFFSFRNKDLMTYLIFFLQPNFLIHCIKSVYTNTYFIRTWIPQSLMCRCLHKTCNPLEKFVYSTAQRRFLPTLSSCFLFFLLLVFRFVPTLCTLSHTVISGRIHNTFTRHKNLTPLIFFYQKQRECGCDL